MAGAHNKRLQRTVIGQHVRACGALTALLAAAEPQRYAPDRGQRSFESASRSASEV